MNSYCKDGTAHQLIDGFGAKTARNMSQIEIQNQVLQLLPEKALLWKEKSILMVSDLHLGKSAHFRKSSYAVPEGLYQNDLERLHQIIVDHKVQRVLILGDLFHSVYNPVWEAFGDFIKNHDEQSFELIVGNHDILSNHQYEKFNIILYKQVLKLEPFVLVHDAADIVDHDNYHFTGHIHPGIRLRGKARQSLRLPCFYFKEKYAVLPAFGSFTGCATIKPGKNDKVFGVLKDEVVDLSPHEVSE